MSLTPELKLGARVMQVQFPDEAKSFPCAVAKRETSLRAGTIVYVEVGATWPELHGKKQRREGQWIRCRSVKVDGNTLHVVRAPEA